ncbi:hypothetical protein M7I_5109 [Glarea lozoyensis 74030]|uniref:Uncharacterized protein n=1 Tax=Glarea lozoyensis (strain ATCC 74030 / MF5533) TaxID=1104152 RepID=H0ER00_GLAL7|nr:hypothetical protein M7I_5109 [Glarea lozoyensis 74030]
MSRRGDTMYEEREFYAREERPPPARTQVREREREFEETDTYSRRGGPVRDNRPDFLRDDYDLWNDDHDHLPRQFESSRGPRGLFAAGRPPLHQFKRPTVRGWSSEKDTALPLPSELSAPRDLSVADPHLRRQSRKPTGLELLSENARDLDRIPLLHHSSAQE